MSALLLALAAPAGADETNTRLLTDFSSDAPIRWYTVNDNVMGGRSRGGFLTNEGVLVFAGATNTNGGGFSSIRTRSKAMDLSDFDGVRLRVKGDGRRYTFRLTTSTARNGRYVPSYWADFETQSGDAWEVVDVPFSRFKPRWRGRNLSGPDLDTKNVDTLGLMIYDKRDGPFRLDVDWIRAYQARPAFSMDRYAWKRRPLLVFAPHADDPRLERQLADIDRTRDAFDERAMALIIVTGKNASIADDETLTRAEADELRSRYGITRSDFAVRLVGKDGGVKRESSDVVPMRTLYSLIDSMPMRQREMRR